MSLPLLLLIVCWHFARTRSIFFSPLSWRDSRLLFIFELAHRAIQAFLSCHGHFDRSTRLTSLFPTVLFSFSVRSPEAMARGSIFSPVLGFPRKAQRLPKGSVHLLHNAATVRSPLLPFCVSSKTDWLFNRTPRQVISLFFASFGAFLVQRLTSTPASTKSLRS